MQTSILVLALQVLKLEAADPRGGVAAPTNLTMNQTLEGHQVQPSSRVKGISMQQEMMRLQRAMGGMVSEEADRRFPLDHG